HHIGQQSSAPASLIQSSFKVHSWFTPFPRPRPTLALAPVMMDKHPGHRKSSRCNPAIRLRKLNRRIAGENHSGAVMARLIATVHFSSLRGSAVVGGAATFVTACVTRRVAHY